MGFFLAAFEHLTTAGDSAFVIRDTEGEFTLKETGSRNAIYRLGALEENEMIPTDALTVATVQPVGPGSLFNMLLTHTSRDSPAPLQLITVLWRSCSAVSHSESASYINSTSSPLRCEPTRV